MREWQELRKEDSEIELLKRILGVLERIEKTLETDEPEPAEGFSFTNSGDNAMPTNFTVVPGQPFQITASTVPVGGALQAGSVPVWTCDDPLVSFTPDPTGLILAGATAATDTAASFNLTLTGVNSAGATISSVQNMVFTPSTPPPTPATGFSFVQNS